MGVPSEVQLARDQLTTTNAKSSRERRIELALNIATASEKRSQPQINVGQKPSDKTRRAPVSVEFSLVNSTFEREDGNPRLTRSLRLAL